MEKRLGKGETIMLNKSSIIAFESNITFLAKRTNIINSSLRGPFIEAIGPGLIIFEMSKLDTPIKNKRRNLSYLALFIMILTSILMFLPLLADIQDLRLLN